MPHKDPAVAKAYRDANRDRRNQAKREHYARNAEKVKVAAREYRKTYKDTTSSDRGRRYREAHPDRVADKNRTMSANRRLVIGASTESVTTQGLLDMYGSDCYLCGESIDLSAPRKTGQPGWENGLHVDHLLALSKGGSHTMDNCRPAHGLCNLRKGASNNG